MRKKIVRPCEINANDIAKPVSNAIIHEDMKNFASQKADVSIFKNAALPVILESPEMQAATEKMHRRNDEAIERDKNQTLSLERIVEMLNDSSQKQDERYQIDRQMAINTYVASVVAAVAAVIATITAIVIAIVK